MVSVSPSPPFQFTLRTLLLLFVVLGSSLVVFGGWGIVDFGLVVGLAIWLRKAVDLRPLVYLAFGSVCLTVIAVAVYEWLQLFDFSVHHESSCRNNLRAISVARMCYHESNGCFPPAFVTDKTGKPTASWRVLILPWLEDEMEYATLRHGNCPGDALEPTLDDQGPGLRLSE